MPSSCLSCDIAHTHSLSHDMAPTRALIQIALLLLLAELDALAPAHALDGQLMLARTMPPFEALNETHFAVSVVDADFPLATTDLDVDVVSWEMEFGQEDFGRSCLGGWGGGGEVEGEGGVAEVEDERGDVADGADGGGADVGFCGAEAGVGGEGGGGGGGGFLGGD